MYAELNCVLILDIFFIKYSCCVNSAICFDEALPI